MVSKDNTIVRAVIPLELKEKLEVIAKKENRSLSNLIRKIIIENENLKVG